MSEERLRAMELTHKDLRDKIAELENKNKISALYFQHIKSWKFKWFITLRKEIKELEQVIEKHKKDIFNLKGNEQAHDFMWENKEKLVELEKRIDTHAEEIKGLEEDFISHRYVYTHKKIENELRQIMNIQRGNVDVIHDWDERIEELEQKIEPLGYHKGTKDLSILDLKKELDEIEEQGEPLKTHSLTGGITTPDPFLKFHMEKEEQEEKEANYEFTPQKDGSVDFKKKEAEPITYGIPGYDKYKIKIPKEYHYIIESQREWFMKELIAEFLSDLWHTDDVRPLREKWESRREKQRETEV